jgi:hypothetical protein
MPASLHRRHSLLLFLLFPVVAFVAAAPPLAQAAALDVVQSAPGLRPAGSAVPAAPAAVAERARTQIALVTADKLGWTPAEQKMDSHLIYAARAMRGEPAVPGLAPLPHVIERAQVDRQGIVTVDIKATVDGSLLAALRALGAQIISALPEYDAVRAQLPIGAVEAAASLPAVHFIGVAQRPHFNRRATPSLTPNAPIPPAQPPLSAPSAPSAPTSGHADFAGRADVGAALQAVQPALPVTAAVLSSEGDHAHGADTVRNLGIAGAGVKVGVLSSGVDSLATQQAAGALPAVTVLSGQGGSGDEGTAMLEIVHTLAPGAQLYFATADGGDAQMASNITALHTAGCAVIIDDATYFDEGVFQDGPIAQAVETVTAAGALYFSSAANNGNKDSGTSGTWEGDFLASATSDSHGVYHDFGGGTTADRINANAMDGITLKWSDPLGASANDYDLYIVNSLGAIEDMSTNRQTGSSDPLEETFSADGAGLFVVVTKFSGSSRALHIDTERGQLQINTAAATFGHNAAAGGLSMAATNVANALGKEFLGGAQDPVETYSSDGFRRIFYQPNGTPITAGNFLIATNGGTVLGKPDITAADCVSNNTPGFSPFCGTSAAAPHAGAIAALALSMPNHPTAAQIKAAMLSSALDVMATGADRDSGSGVVMADRLIAALTPVPSPISFFTLPPCRLLDTRNAAGPLGGPALQAGALRTFQLTGVCGIPTSAVALSVNVTVTQTAAAGDLRVYPADLTSSPLTSAINFSGGQTLANNAVVKLGAVTGSIDVRLDSAGTTHFILDVNGYFQ